MTPSALRRCVLLALLLVPLTLPPLTLPPPALAAAPGPPVVPAVSLVPVVPVEPVPAVPLVPVVPVGAFGWPLGGVDPSGPPARAGSVGAVTRPFEPPPHYYGRGHRGADLAGRPGLAVLAAGDGTVVFAGAVAGRGVVAVEHAGGLRTTYEPLDVTVIPGTVVRRGDPLGTLASGHARCPVAACLHWGLRRPGPASTVEYLDPLLLVGLGPVRLLPL